MNNKEVIIEKILSDAKATAAENISKAQEEVKAIEDSTNKAIQDYREANLPKGAKQAEEIKARRQMVTNLDCKKLMLSKKTSIVDNVFDTVAVKMRKNDEKGYIELIVNMIAKNADDNDEVIISKFDKDIITDAVVQKAAKKCKKKLSLSSKVGDFDGGVMLSGEKFDKNLTFELEFSLIKQESELELAKILFGE